MELTKKFGSELGGRDETGAFLLFVATANGPLVVVAVDEQAKFSDGSAIVFVAGNKSGSRGSEGADNNIPVGGVVAGVFVGFDIAFHYLIPLFGGLFLSIIKYSS